MDWPSRALEHERRCEDFTKISLAVLLRTEIMLGAVRVVGWSSGLPAADQFSLAMVLAMRNAALAAAVVVTTLGRSEFAVSATTSFLDQVPLLLGALVCFGSAER